MSSALNALESDRSLLESWFEHMHENPELSMREERTARFIAGLLEPWGYEVVTGVGKHGVVASLKVGDGSRAIGLRADFDALPIREVNDLPYRSKVEACRTSAATTGTPPCC